MCDPPPSLPSSSALSNLSPPGGGKKGSLETEGRRKNGLWEEEEGRERGEGEEIGEGENGFHAHINSGRRRRRRLREREGDALCARVGLGGSSVLRRLSLFLLFFSLSKWVKVDDRPTAD